MNQPLYKKGDYVDASRMWYVQPKITSNARILVSRNKREGHYGGCVTSGRSGKSKPKFVRTRFPQNFPSLCLI